MLGLYDFRHMERAGMYDLLSSYCVLLLLNT